MRTVMITAVNLNYRDEPVEYVLTESARTALKALGYELKTVLQPEKDAA